MKLLSASFRGVQFHEDEATESVEWRYQVSEFITEHKPTTTRFSRAADEGAGPRYPLALRFFSAASLA
jgi:hypothetical protein